MTPKEKAIKLVEFYAKKAKDLNQGTDWEYDKQCALIVVDEIINEYQSISDLESILVVNNEITFVIDKIKYWQEVKQEIEKL